MIFIIVEIVLFDTVVLMEEYYSVILYSVLKADSKEMTDDIPHSILISIRWPFISLFVVEGSDGRYLWYLLMAYSVCCSHSDIIRCSIEEKAWPVLITSLRCWPFDVQLIPFWHVRKLFSDDWPDGQWLTIWYYRLCSTDDVPKYNGMTIDYSVFSDWKAIQWYEETYCSITIRSYIDVLMTVDSHCCWPDDWWCSTDDCRWPWCPILVTYGGDDRYHLFWYSVVMIFWRWYSWRSYYWLRYCVIDPWYIHSWRLPFMSPVFNASEGNSDWYIDICEGIPALSGMCHSIDHSFSCPVINGIRWWRMMTDCDPLTIVYSIDSDYILIVLFSNVTIRIYWWAKVLVTPGNYYSDVIQLYSSNVMTSFRTWRLLTGRKVWPMIQMWYYDAVLSIPVKKSDDVPDCEWWRVYIVGVSVLMAACCFHFYSVILVFLFWFIVRWYIWLMIQFGDVCWPVTDDDSTDADDVIFILIRYIETSINVDDPDYWLVLFELFSIDIIPIPVFQW